MKKLILLLLTTFTLSCCNNDDDKPIAEIDKLPPETQTGANTAGCLVNGQAFLPGGQSLQPLVCNYLDGESFTLGISKKENNIYYSINIYMLVESPLEVGQTYLLSTSDDVYQKTGEYTLQYPLPNLYELHYKTNNEIIGELTITHHDFNNAILSGTFWFDAKFNYIAYPENYTGEINENEIIQIREGRFDMQY